MNTTNSLVTLYNEDGLITQCADLSQDTIELYATMGFMGLVGVKSDPKTQYVVNERLFQYTEDEIRARETMRPGMVWQMPQKVVVDLRELEETKEKKSKWINTQRDLVIAAFYKFEWNGYVFDGDAPAEVNIKKAARSAELGLELPEGFSWRLFDNTDLPMTNADILEMEKAFTAAQNMHTYIQHGTARYLKALVAAAETTSEVDLITWPEDTTN